MVDGFGEMLTARKIEAVKAELEWVELGSRFDPCQTLGLSRSASPVSVKAAYRKLARQYHPDTRQGNLIGFAQTRMQRINEAYAILRCVERRAAYGKLCSQGD